jgi:UDP-glucuronate 4-epimerase
MKRVLVTGAAGFIGFHCCQALVARGDFVIGIDNFNDYYDPKLKRGRQEILLKQGIEIIDADICDGEILSQLVQKDQISHILHLAAQAGVRYSLENPQAYIHSNIDGFLSILELCRKYAHLKLTYASSSSVYGLNSKIPFSESDRTDHQASLYGVTKKSNELMAASYHHLFQIPVTGLRFFTVYGPWGRPDMAYYTFTRDILAGRPISVFNHGDMMRDFTYIDDIVSGVLSAIDRESPCAVYNLGNNTPERLGTFIEIIENSLGVKGIKKMVPMQAGDVLSTYADISLSQRELGFSPKTSLAQGIPKFVEWYRSYSN